MREPLGPGARWGREIMGEDVEGKGFQFVEGINGHVGNGLPNKMSEVSHVLEIAVMTTPYQESY